MADLLFRPLTPKRRGFKESSLRSSSLASRIHLHLAAAGLYEGETGAQLPPRGFAGRGGRQNGGAIAGPRMP